MAVAALLAVGGCAGTPEPLARSEPAPVDLQRTQTQTHGRLTVTVSIPSEAIADQLFDVPVTAHGIQPVWLSIRNDDDADYWLLPVALDRDYYSPDEAALVAGARLHGQEQAALTEAFRANAIPLFVKRGSSNEGYVYASYTRGGRLVDVRLSGHGKGERFRFAVLLPTQGFDYELSALRQLYSRRSEFPDLTVPELQLKLRTLPCCTASADGTGSGDPLNVVLVGSGELVISALISAGWSLTEAITADSVRKMIGAAISRMPFANAPVSPLYLLGRPQDLALQRGRSSISQRNHMRLWLAPFRCKGQPVWVGQVSRDIGVKLTSRSPSLTTHVIDPVVDEAREYLLHSLLEDESVEQFAFGRGVGAATREQPRRNLVGDPYFTDGMRLIVFLSLDPVVPEAARNLAWNESTDPILEAQGEAATVPQDRR